MTALDRLRQVLGLTSGARRYDVDQFSEILRGLTVELRDHPDREVRDLAARLGAAL